VQRVLELLRDLRSRERVTIVVVTHDPVGPPPPTGSSTCATAAWRTRPGPPVDAERCGFSRWQVR